MKRIHLGSGTIYLDGWLNVDVQVPGVYLAKDRPDLVEAYKTTEDKYYARHEDKTIDKLRKGPVTNEYVCDIYGDWQRMPCGIGEVDEILARHSFEHMSLTEARKALDEVDRVLKSGGTLRIDVPDHEQSLKNYRETGDEFYVRHILGPRRNDHGYHVMGYTRKVLADLVQEFGFVFVEEEPNIHFYPAFTLKFIKPHKPIPREYALEGESIHPSWRVGDLGPGSYPWSRADVYVDIDQSSLDKLIQSNPGKQYIQASLNDQMPFENGYFDYLFCSHVLEHTTDPVASLREISRVAKRGTIVLPHAFKEYLFLHEEGDHKWLCFNPKQKGGPIGFMPIDGIMKSNIADSNVQSTLCRLYRTGPNRLDHDQRLLRKWYQRTEKYMDVIVHWEGSVSGAYIW